MTSCLVGTSSIWRSSSVLNNSTRLKSQSRFGVGCTEQVRSIYTDAFIPIHRGEFPLLPSTGCGKILASEEGPVLHFSRGFEDGKEHETARRLGSKRSETRAAENRPRASGRPLS